jgi:hypothetical protein
LGPIVAALIFIVGHAITIFMNTLGAFVHPMRLTFVEFYKNAEFRVEEKSIVLSENYHRYIDSINNNKTI